MPRPAKKPAANAAPIKTPAKPALTGSIGAVQDAINKVTSPSTVVTVALVTMASLLAMPEADLVNAINTQSQSFSSQHIGMGKMLFAFAQRRGDMPLSKYAKKQGVVEIDSSAYKTSNAYYLVGEGHGHIEEKHFDACKLRWLIVVSQILNQLEKFADGPEKQEIREAVAVTLRAPSEKTPDILKGIYDQLKPPANTGKGGEGEGKGEEAENEAAEKPLGVRLSALQLVDLLIQEIKASGKRALECNDAAVLDAAMVDMPKLKEELERATNAARMLAALIADKKESLSETAPAAAVVELAAAA